MSVSSKLIRSIRAIHVPGTSACGTRMTLNELMIAAQTLLLSSVVSFAQTPIDPAQAPYKKTSGVSGTLSSIGSDTMTNLMTYWTEAFKEFYPIVNIQVEGKGSGTAPPALISQTAQLAPMSRQMKEIEIDQFEHIYGYKPAVYRVAIDAIAVYVNQDNPLQAISRQQLDAVFSITRRGGGVLDIASWGQLGLSQSWSRRIISLYGRNSASGTYSYFKEHALYHGDFKSTLKELPGSGSVVHAVKLDRDAIGFAGVGYFASGVRALSLKTDDGQIIPPTMEAALSGEYPFSRFLYIYVNQKPGTSLDPLVREFLRFVFSKEGQQMVIKDGYLPVPASLAEQELARLQ